MIDLLGLPFLACLVLTGIHAYLGLHVLARGVIFVDLALAQVAALGITVALLAGHAPGSPAAYWYALTFAVGGGLLFALTRVRRSLIPQEAIIGIVYAVSAALTVLVVDRAPQGAERIKQLLVGSILTVTASDIAGLAALYAGVGLVHVLVRRPLLAISLTPTEAAGLRIVAWDALFYGSFALVVTSSVRLAGVLLVFSYLVIPAAIAVMLVAGVSRRLVVGWLVGAIVSGGGLVAAYQWDLPTGAAVVAAFGAALALTAMARGAHALTVAVRARGLVALRPAGLTLAALVTLAGALLTIIPTADHPWLDGLERVVPSLQDLFLTATERGVRRDTAEALARSESQLSRLRTLESDVQWGTQMLDPERRERLRQFLAGRSELVAGDRLVLRTLRAKARERQRYWLGLPLLAAGGIVIVRISRRSLGRAGVTA